MTLQITSIRVMDEYEFEFGELMERQTGENRIMRTKTCPCATSFIANTARPASNQTLASAVSLCNDRSSLFALYARTLVIQMVYCQITVSQHNRVAAETKTRDFPKTSPNYSMIITNHEGKQEAVRR
jgi:hypothetical protein